MIKGFKMKLFPGQEAEYEKRHNELWPEMQDMIHAHGGKNYTIFLDKETLTLFGYIEIEDEENVLDQVKHNETEEPQENTSSSSKESDSDFGDSESSNTEVKS